IFTSRNSQEESTELGRGVDERLLGRPIQQVVIADVKRFGGITRPLANMRLESSAKEGLDRRRKRREQQHVDASPREVNRWHLIGDFDGWLLKKFGVPQALSHPRAFVVERSGEVHGPYGDVASVVGEVVKVTGGSAPAKAALNTSPRPASRLRTASW